jgi:hypothetical protein
VVEELNPYAPPAYEAAGEDPDEDDEPGYWRDGQLLIVEHGARLPKRVCLMTGRRARGKRWRSSLSWMHPGLGLVLFLLFSGIGLLLGWLAFRRRLVFRHGLSDAGRARLHRGQLLVRASALLGSAGILLGLGLSFYPLTVFALLVLLVGVFVGRRMSKVAPVAWIRDGEAALRVDEVVFEALDLDDDDD